MLLIRFVTLIVLLVALTPPGQAVGYSAVETYLDDSFDNSNVPGMAVAVTRGEEILVSEGFGVDGDGNPMTAQTPIRAASLTKSVTSVAVHQLAEQDLIDLDDPVAEHLPEFRLADARYDEITIQQLLDNRSGIRDDQLDLTHLNSSTSLDEYVAELGDATLATEPGEAEAYCNANWEVLARMVEVVSEQSYDDYLNDEVFSPLGMSDSTMEERTVDVPSGYQEIFGFHVPREYDLLFSASSGSNGLITTAADLALWSRWVASGDGENEILSPSTREKIIDRAVAEQGADGFEMHGNRLGKNGMQHTEMSQLLTTPAHGFGVAVVINSSNMAGPTFAVADGALDVLEGDHPEPVGSGWWVITAVYLAVAALAIGAGVTGVRRAPPWARNQVPRRRWVSALRLLWLPIPALLLLGLPKVASLLTNGIRTATWGQLSYLFLTPLVVLILMTMAGLTVLTARIVALRSHRSNTRPGQ